MNHTEKALARRMIAANRIHIAREKARTKLALAAPAAADVLVKAARGGDVRAADSVLDRVIGKPVQSVLAAVAIESRPLSELTDDELDQRAIRQGLIDTVATAIE